MEAVNVSFEDLRKKFNSASHQIKKMNVESLNFFCDSHDIKVVINFLGDIGEAQKYVCYKYLEKLCALNAISMPEKWRARLEERKRLYKGSTNIQQPEKTKGKRGSRAAIIKSMLMEDKPKGEIVMAVAEQFPEVPLSNIGCQIAATRVFLRKKEEQC